MTTIAADRSCIAGDRLLSDDLGSPGMYVNKIFEVRDSIFGCAGHFSEMCVFIEWQQKGARGKRPVPMASGESASVIELCPDGLYYWEGRHRVPIRNSFYAIGSGASCAMVAMEMGASPAQAIPLAAKYDTFTGSDVDVVFLPQAVEKKTKNDEHKPVRVRKKVL